MGALFVTRPGTPRRQIRIDRCDVSTGGGELVVAASVSAATSAQAEEMAIALALAFPSSRVVLSDSKTVVRNYSRNMLCCGAVRVLKGVDLQHRPVTIKSFPTHVGRSNETQ